MGTFSRLVFAVKSAKLLYKNGGRSQSLINTITNDQIPLDTRLEILDAITTLDCSRREKDIDCQYVGLNEIATDEFRAKLTELIQTILQEFSSSKQKTKKRQTQRDADFYGNIREESASSLMTIAVSY